jgi:hypothetical protein
MAVETLAADLLVDAHAQTDGQLMERHVGLTCEEQGKKERHETALVVLRPESEQEIALHARLPVPHPRGHDRVDVRSEEQLWVRAPPDRQVVRRTLDRLTADR